MSEENFEKLRDLARKEFGVEILRNEKASNFKEVFGFDVEEIKS
jgi:hypothetical protein